jgi:transposase
VVPQNFLAFDRDQELLLPPSLRDWLGEDHLAWCVLDAVEQIDLSGIYGAYRADGWGRAAFDPQMMVALLLYAYAVGERSSRMIERRCQEDVAFRVISANQAPDHATIARFRARHEQALADLFTAVLELCAKAGLVSVGLVALDGTKIAANAALCQTKTYESINTEMQQILEEAADADAQEDAEFGVGSRGDELPAELADRRSRRARLERCRAELEAEHAEREQTFREHLRDRERWEQKAGKKLGGRKPQPPAQHELTQAKLNVTDPDSRVMKDKMTLMQGYNAQVIASPEQVILAAALTQEPNDSRQLPPMIAQASRAIQSAGISEPIGTVVADGGYWSERAVTLTERKGVSVLVPPFSQANATMRKTATPHSETAKRMHALLQEPAAVRAHRQRKQIVEPVFANTKTIRRADRFMRRGLPACEAEWQLIATTHNLLKLWRHRRPSG